MRCLLIVATLSVVPLLIAPASITAASASAPEEMTVDQVIETLKEAIRQKNDPMRNRMFLELRALDKKAVPALVDLLKTNEPGISEYAAFTLGWIADTSSIGPLVQLLDRGNSSQKQKALQALGNMAWGTVEKIRREVHKQAVGAMIPYLRSEDIRVQREAAYSLGLAGDTKAIPDLEKLKTHEDKVVRFLAEEAIDRIRSVNR